MLRPSNHPPFPQSQHIDSSGSTGSSGRLTAHCPLPTVHCPPSPTAEKVNRACVIAFAQHLAKSGVSGKTRKNILSDLGTIWECLRMERDGITNCWKLVKVDTTDSERGKPF